MVKKILSISIIFLFLGISSNTSYSIDNVKNASIPIKPGNILYVGGSGGGNYSTIQNAIDNASDGDSVFVYGDSSPYLEYNIIISQSINLIGENRETTVIDGQQKGSVLIVMAGMINISGFTIRNSSKKYCEGIYIHSNNNIITDNIILKNNDGINLYDSSSNTIMGNIIISNSFEGIFLRDCSSNIIMDNTLSSNHGDGLGFIYSNNNKISDNTITENIGNGLYFCESSNNTIICNNFELNKCADIHIRNSSNNNSIYHNNFLNKYRNAYDICINIWDNDYPSGGNYWDDYTGEDSDGDGIGDTPYLVPGGNNKDRYPLMKPLKPKLNIAIKRGLRRSICVDIENIGSGNVSDIKWNVIVTRRGIMKRTILNSSGNISTLEEGLSEKLFNRAFGFGFIKVTVNVTAYGIDPIKITKKGFISLRFIRFRRFL